ncbi:MAG: MerR family transcriptional regulator [Oscillospiraceae bacterium]|nr:MerR family transcriptional regulator [Oscillospiraceae bacterium]
MDKYKAIPEGYMTVGQLAKKMGITVRALHHYDKQGLLSPSGESEGGYRLYSDKDIVILHQILAMKHLGFSLEDIKTHLVSLDTPNDVAKALAEHAAAIRSKLESLTNTLVAVEVLKEEVMRMQSVDFKKYADIVAQLQMKHEHYWTIKHFDSDVLDGIRSKVAYSPDGFAGIFEPLRKLQLEAIDMHEAGIAPDSEKGQDLASRLWGEIQKITGGDAEMLAKFEESLTKMGEDEEGLATMDEAEKEKLMIASDYMHQVLVIYLAKNEGGN